MSTSVSVRISEDLVQKLDEIAKETERSRAFHIQKALEIYNQLKTEVKALLKDDYEIN